MKRLISVLLVLLLLPGCKDHREELDRAMALRAKLLSQEGVSFDVSVTADYGDQIYTFAMTCKTDNQGNLGFTVTAPDAISGIKGLVSATGGKLTFEDTALSFELMADDQLSPVSAPWILIHTLRGGYLTSCTSENGLLRVAIDDSYDDDALHLDIWLNEADIPIRADVLWDGRRLLSMEVTNFTFL